MSEISGINSAMNLAAASMRVHSAGIQVTAHNIANISTGDFEPQRATYATGSRGVGVELESVRKIPVHADMHGEAPRELQSLWGGAAPSGTEIARELPHMISSQHGYEANAAVVRAADEMYGTLLSLKA